MECRGFREPPARPLVLVADSHNDTCELYAISLQAFGFETTTVRDGVDAYAHVSQMHPDVIVTEISLPRLDGWEFIREVKRNARTREIPIVIVTTDGQPAARERAKQEGCAAFLLKPCVPDLLATRLRDVLSGRSGHDEPAPAC